MSTSPSSAAPIIEERLPPPSRAVLYLLYHELSADPGAYKYALNTKVFREHLHLCRRMRNSGGEELWPEITFDDGHLSNFDQAMPSLADADLQARFFITAGWTGQRPEYMSWNQLREVAQAGHSIGAHGWSHRLLTHCSDVEMETELGRARAMLQDRLGLSITSISLPGGRFDKRVLAACRRHGYTQIFTSIPRVEALPSTEIVGRLNLRSDARREWLESVLASPTGPIRRIERQYRLKTIAQRIMGDTLYAKVWARVNKAQVSAEAS